MTPHLPLPDEATAGPALAGEYAARAGDLSGQRSRVLAEAHAALLAELGGAGAVDRDQALVDFARRLTLAPREAREAVAELRSHLTDAEVHDAIAVMGLPNFANRAALATGITAADDLR